jgi:peroxiredoxin
VPFSGLLLLAGLLVPAAPPAAPAVGPARLLRGLELVYRGEVVEGSDRYDNRFRKTSELEVRVFVLDAGPDSADCAVMTSVRPKRDTMITAAAAAVTGADPARAETPPAVRLEFIRVDARGRCKRLRPPAGPPPVPLGPDTPTESPLPTPIDGPPLLELGMFVPFPPATVVNGTWDMIDPGRPPVVWTADKETVWNGGRCTELTATQRTDGWDRPMVAPTGWERRETVLAAPSEGYAAAVRRRTERREGVNVIGWVEVRYELQPPTRLTGVRYTDLRHEAEAAFCFAQELDKLSNRPGPHNPGPFAVKLTRIERYLSDNPNPTGFRAAVETVRRRYAAAIHGEVTPAAVSIVSATKAAEMPDVGKPAPDFVAPVIGAAGTFRLSAARGKPAVVVFFKPGSGTSRATLIVTEALTQKLADRACVVAISVGAEPDTADAMRKDMRLTVPVLDGAGVRDRYGVDTYPRFFIVDPAGNLAWRFDGFGLEAGYLAKQEVERLIRDGSAKNR